MALGNLLDTAEGRAELRELISAVRQEDPDGEAARYRRLRQALRELLASVVTEGTGHEAAPTEQADGIYVCVNFLPDLVYGQNDSVVRRDYVDPLLFCEELQSFPLTGQPTPRLTVVVVLPVPPFWLARAIIRQLG